MARWSKQEDEAVVALYKRLFVDQQRGVTFDVSREISLMSGINKTEKAIRNRMQNVSAVLEEKGLPRLRNISPWRNYTRDTKEAVADSLPW